MFHGTPARGWRGTDRPCCYTVPYRGGHSLSCYRQAPQPTVTSRAQVINPRALELLEPTGVTAMILKEARPIHRTLFYEGWEKIAERPRGLIE